MAKNDSFLDDLNEQCVGCLEDTTTELAECTTTVFSADSPVSVTATVEASTKLEYDVCCDPIAIEPVTFSICSRGTVFFQDIQITVLPENGKLYIGSEEIEANDVLTKQENGLLVYKRTIDADAENGLQEVGTDSFTFIVRTNGGNSAAVEVTFNLLEATCLISSPCDGCGC